MSKRNPLPVPPVSGSRASAAYWLRRLFRNSYTRGGLTHVSGRWSVKIQHQGRRQTHALQSRSRKTAAMEARDLYARVVDEAGGRTIESPRRAAAISRPRLLVRPHPPSTSAGISDRLSAHIEHLGRNHYFPLNTADPAVAGRSAQRILQVARRHGIAAAQARFSCELTLAVRWVANPMAWTYFTVHTRASPPGDTGVRSAGPRTGKALPVAVMEPDSGLRLALMECVNGQAGYRCVAGFAETAEALLWLSRQRVALLLVNHTLNDLSGAGFLERLHHLAPHVPGLLYSVYDDSDQLFRSTPGGAIGYLLRRTPGDRIFEPLAGNAGEDWPSTGRITQRVLAYFRQLIGSRAPEGAGLEMARLTPRELEILGLLSKGFLDKEIAHALQISAWTVHGHAKNIYEKLGVHSRTEAVVKYLQR